MPLKVLHYLPSIDTRAGGPIRAVYDLSEALASRGHTVTIVTGRVPPEGVPVRYRECKPGVPHVIHIADALYRKQWLRGPARERIRDLIAQHEVLHVHGVWDISNVQLADIAYELGKPYYISVRGMLDDWSISQKFLKKRLFLAATRKRFLDRAAEIHLTAEGELDQARKWIDGRKGTVISNLLDLNPYRNPPGTALARKAFPCLETDLPVVLFLSRVHYKKGPEVLIDAAASLRAKGIDAAFVFAGACDDEYRAKLLALAHERGVHDRVHFIGHVDGAMKISVYQNARVMALPTSQENFGFVFPESLACGTPVITTKGVDIWPTLERGGGSIIVDRTPQAFAEAIAKVLRDDALHARMSHQGREFVMEEFDESLLVKRFEAMYHRSRARAAHLDATTRITHFVDSTDLRAGGVPRVVLDVARTLAQVGRPSTIITGDTLDTPENWLANAKPVQEPGHIDTRVPAVYKVPIDTRVSTAISPAGMRDVVEILRRTDVVHLHCVWSVANLQIADACQAMGIPYVLTTHGMLDDWSMDQGRLKKRVYMRLGGRAMLEHAAFVLCTAQGEIDQSHKWFPEGNGRVLTYIIDLEPYRTLPGMEPALRQFPALAEARKRAEPVILFLSRLHYKKGCDFLIKAAKIALDRGMPATYVFAGAGDEDYIQSLKSLAQSLGLTDRVHFVGMVKGQTKVSMYEAADLFVLPTSQENFGLVLIEAMACNTPVMTTRGTDIWKDIEGSGSGIIVDQSETAIADQLCSLFADKARLTQLRAGARKWVFDNYEESVLVAKYAQLYTDAARTRTPSRRVKLIRTPAVLWLLGKWNQTPTQT
ncbi:MAG TPA: glycosyltransferase [Phycisphaerales bacterium]|nr:glycosyltransferase [Phycisphaerales bacterium]